jgi:hypothetical protein
MGEDEDGMSEDGMGLCGRNCLYTFMAGFASFGWYILVHFATVFSSALCTYSPWRDSCLPSTMYLLAANGGL